MLPQSVLASNSLPWRPRSRDSAQRHPPKARCKIVFGSQLASARPLLSAHFPIVAVPPIMIGCSQYERTRDIVRSANSRTAASRRALFDDLVGCTRSDNSQIHYSFTDHIHILL